MKKVWRKFLFWLRYTKEERLEILLLASILGDFEKAERLWSNQR